MSLEVVILSVNLSIHHFIACWVEAVQQMRVVSGSKWHSWGFF